MNKCLSRPPQLSFARTLPLVDILYILQTFLWCTFPYTSAASWCKGIGVLLNVYVSLEVLILYNGKPWNVFLSWAAAMSLLWLNSTLAFENNSTLLIFYLIYSMQAFPHQAGVLILSQNKSVSLYSDMLSLHQQKKENFRIRPQDYITTKQCLFLTQLKFFLLPGISKTGKI